MKFLTKLKRFFKVFGPGIITGASDDDPSGIATYSQAGAKFGLATLWTALVMFPMVAAIQEMCARIGLVTKKGLTGVIKQHYPKPLLYMLLLFSFPAITLNIGADIQGMGAVMNMLIPQVPSFVFSILFTIILIYFIIRFKYEQIVNVLKWLCLVLLLYILVPFVIHTHWKNVFQDAIIPNLHFNKDYLMILVGVMGTTISPYLFFWQTSIEAEVVLHTRKKHKMPITDRVVKEMRKDVFFGMFVTCMVMFFIVVTTGTVLFEGGINNIETVDQAARALEPLAGQFAYLLFAIGVIGTGLLAIPVLTGALSYMLAEMFKWSKGLDKKFQQAKGFYLTIIASLLIGLSLEFIGISPITALLWAAVLYGLTAPIMITMIIHICNNKKIMKDKTNGMISNIFGYLTLFLNTAAAIALLYFLFT